MKPLPREYFICQVGWNEQSSSGEYDKLWNVYDEVHRRYFDPTIEQVKRIDCLIDLLFDWLIVKCYAESAVFSPIMPALFQDYIGVLNQFGANLLHIAYVEGFVDRIHKFCLPWPPSYCICILFNLNCNTPFDWLKNWIISYYLRHNKSDVKTYQSAWHYIQILYISRSFYT